jgi:lipid-A-disaccharide synthase
VFLSIFVKNRLFSFDHYHLWFHFQSLRWSQYLRGFGVLRLWPDMLFQSMSSPSQPGRKIKVLISAGEASGEMYGAALLESLRAEAALRAASIECFGLGGERMREAGCQTVIDANRVAVVGLAEVISHLPKIYREFHNLLREVDARKPDVAVLIDFPDWNLRLAKQLHKRGVPVVYYVSPQLWAWRKGRIKQIQKYVRKMLVIFPFEQEFYAKHAVEALFVGHPLAEIVESAMREPSAGVQRIALLPGSRRKEITMNLPTMLAAAAKLQGEFEFEIPCASTIDRGWMKAMLDKVRHAIPGAEHLRIELTRDSKATLAGARAAIVASGTATVEAAVVGVPFVMIYMVSPLTYFIGKNLVDVPHYGMVNLIAGRRVIPELIQRDFTAERVVRELEPLLKDGPQREQMLLDLREVREKLRGTNCGRASENAAKAVLEVVKA